MISHSVKWGPADTPSFTCNADPLAPCRFGCPNCDQWSYCGGFTDAYYNNCDEIHPLSPHCHCGTRLEPRDCSAVEWIDALGHVDTYVPTDVEWAASSDHAIAGLLNDTDDDEPEIAEFPTIDGPVVIDWDGDSYVWYYPDVTP